MEDKRATEYSRVSNRKDTDGSKLLRRLQCGRRSGLGLYRNSMNSFLPSVGRNPEGPRLSNVSDQSFSAPGQNVYELEESVDSRDSSEVPLNATSVNSNDNATHQLLLKVLGSLDDVKQRLRSLEDVKRRLSRLESPNSAAAEVKANSTISYITSKTSETTANTSSIPVDYTSAVPASTKKESADDEISSLSYVVPPSSVTGNAVKLGLGFHTPNGAEFGRQFALQDIAPTFGSDVYIRTPVDGCPDKGSALPNGCNSASFSPLPKQSWFVSSGQFYSPPPPDTSDQCLDVSHSVAPAQ